MPAAGYRPLSPPPDRRIVWPADFGQRYTIFVDTEEEFDWSAPFDRDQRAVTATRAIPDATRRFADLGAALTFLVDHPIATDPSSIAAIGRAVADSGAAVGAQLHPWVNPPHLEEINRYNSFVGNLPTALQAAKLHALGDAIVTAFGTAPRTFRAGRYGLSAETIPLLAARGYRIDTSMRAGFDYAAEGGPDYRNIDTAAFALGDGDLIELPFSTIFTGALRGGGAGLHRRAARLPRGIGLLARTRLLNRVSLTPEGVPLDEAREAIAVALGEGVPLLSLAFHSPSLVLGHTPYTRDAGALATFWRWWDGILGDLARRGVGCASELDLIGALDRTTRG